MSRSKWTSKKIYKHPAEHLEQYGNIVQSESGIYVMQTGGSRISCPQDWAAKMHFEEQETEND